MPPSERGDLGGLFAMLIGLALKLGLLGSLPAHFRVPSIAKKKYRAPLLWWPCFGVFPLFCKGNEAKKISLMRIGMNCCLLKDRRFLYFQKLPTGVRAALIQFLLVVDLWIMVNV